VLSIGLCNRENEMFHPDIVSELAKMRQRELLEEAKKNMLIKQIRFHIASDERKHNGS
jgi:hypothetical protein